jgi:uncharacterized Ntn-hydrolase superfamily protein
MTNPIVALDPPTGELGVAVQSRRFAVGSVVLWARWTPPSRRPWRATAPC